MSKRAGAMPYHGRYRLIQMVVIVAVALVSSRLVYLQVWKQEWLQDRSDERTIRQITLPGRRGNIYDRNGVPLAVSTVLKSLKIHPENLNKHRDVWPQLARLMKISEGTLAKQVKQALDKGANHFYLGKELEPEEAKKFRALKMRGVFEERSYQRYYPTRELAGQVVGKAGYEKSELQTIGRTGIERRLNNLLTGKNGEMQLVRNAAGLVIEEADILESPRAGQDITLSLDLRLQYAANRALARTVKKYNAVSGSVVILDAHSGEVLSMVNQPTFNPNFRESYDQEGAKNRAIIHEFEPGSVMKPFTIVAALESGRYKPHTVIDTRPGYMNVSGDLVKDGRNYGVIDVTGVITHSSNVGASKMALDLGAEKVVSVLQRVGFGQSTGVSFPGENTGRIPYRLKWRPIETATLSFGYGVTTNVLQLAQAYAVFANDGKFVPVSLLKKTLPEEGEQVIDPVVARQVRKMMTTVVSKGTGRRAGIDGYQVAGKTGTAKKYIGNGYSDKDYISMFAGMVPADDPRIVVVVMVDTPRTGTYYGGVVSAPVFAEVAGKAMRILGISPDPQKGLVASHSRNEGR